jgi:solute carrier family 25 phosphate transporter 23/24/25/41
MGRKWCQSVSPRQAKGSCNSFSLAHLDHRIIPLFRLRVFPAKSVVFSCNDYYRALFSQILQTEQLPAPASFLAGGLSGMTATAVTYPLDLARGRISGKLAVAKGQKVYRGIVQTILLTVREEGVAALFKGITPTILGALPYEGIKFGTVGAMERLFPEESSSISTPVRKMIFGGIGGVMAGLITYPNDTVRRLLQLQGSRGNSYAYAGFWDCVRQTYRTHGVSRFYHGLTINTIRMAPNTALQFYFYSLLKQWSEGLV